MAKKIGKVNASRVLSALGRIGYHPVSAILDIVDNSVSANAGQVKIVVETEQKKVEGVGRKKTTIKSFLLIDNGNGMNEAGIDNAISLGSSEDFYEEGTLSKFGMGLKSASSSLGNVLEIISRQAGAPSLAAKLDQRQLFTNYEYDVDEAGPEDIKLLDDFAGEGGAGTIIRITDIHLDCMPPIAEILDGLKSRAGVIFYYHLKGEEPAKHKVSISLNGDMIEPLDPLFVDKLKEEDSDLEEYSWDGLEPKWINRPTKIALDSEGKCFATVEMTQLPHPPSVGTHTENTAAECRKEYMIGAGNYGFYIYRNGRLISWADSLNGQIQQDQDLYSFRGRLLIGSDADDILNIDVTKSRIHLSEIAKEQLYPLVQEAKKKSLEAWKNAKDELSRLSAQDPHSDINAELSKLGELDEKSDKIDEEASPEEERKQLKERREKLTSNCPATEEESKKLAESDQRVQYVDALENGQLWARAHDPKLGLIVRVNKSHPINREVLTINSENGDLIKFADILFYGLARGEFEVLYKTDFDDRLVEKIMDEYRERVGGSLSEVIRRLKKAE